MAANVIACPSCGKKNRVPAVASGSLRCAVCKASLPWTVDASDVTFDEIVATSLVVIVDLWAAWCGPCRMVAPVLDQLAVAHAGVLKVVKVDVDANPALAQRFQAQSIPLLLVMTGGQVRERIVGAQPYAALDRAVTPFLPASA